MPLRQGPSGNVTLQVTNKASSTGTKDSLTIYLRPWDSTYTLPQSIGRLRLWAALNYIYAGTQPGYTPHDVNFCRNNLHLYQTPAQKSKDKNSETPNQTTTTLTSRKVTTWSGERTPLETTTETTRQMTHETTVEPNVQTDDQKPTQTPEALSKPALRALIQYLSHLSHTLRPVAATLSAAKSKPYQDYLNNVRKCLPESIELRTDTVPAEKAKDLISTSPLLKTYSALGILKHPTGQNSPKFAFVSPDDYLKIREFPALANKLARIAWTVLAQRRNSNRAS